MPERYTITCAPSTLTEELRVEVPGNYRPRYNAAPAQLLPVITSVAPRGLSYFYWGTIPGWAGNKTLSSRIITVPAEQLRGKPMYRTALRSHRCLVPADGFYVWKKLGKKTRIPYRVQLSDKSVFCFAGIWEEFEDENDQFHHIFKIIQVPATDRLKEFDDLMPLILQAEDARIWLHAGTEDAELKRILEMDGDRDLVHYTVSPKIDDMSLDHPGLIREVASMNQFGNYSLFD